MACRATCIYLHAQWHLKLTRYLCVCGMAVLLQAVTKAAFKHNLLLMTAGARESIRFLPPLNVTAEEIYTCLNGFEAACKEVCKQ
jgi:acetylornithine/succinyldiaminopimelate/putrescine aminotransferase